MEREQFTFYRSFFAGIARIRSKTARCDAYDAIINYALNGTEPDLDSMPDAAASVYEMAKPVLDASRKKAENGRRGGESKQEANAKQTEANVKQTEANDKQEKVKGQDKGQDKDKEQMLIESGDTLPQDGRKGRTIFRPPTIDEVADYCRERHNNVDPERFVNFYAAKGWMVGKNRMKDWMAAVRTWEHREDSPQAKTAANSGGGFLGIVENMREGDSIDVRGNWNDSDVCRDLIPDSFSWTDG